MKLVLSQAPREDLFTPIHKSIRSMIYRLGSQLQKTDFTDQSATESMVAQLKQNLQYANSNCIICLLHDHSGHEDESIFPQIAQFESKAVEEVIQEHVAVTKRIIEISTVADELVQLKDNGERIDAGNRLNRLVNSLFAYYLAHLNKEEETILPLTWKYLTDEQLRAIRTKIQMTTPPEKFAQWLRWMLPSLNVSELTGMFLGLKKGVPPPVLEKMMGLAEQDLDPETWKKLKERANL